MGRLLHLPVGLVSIVEVDRQVFPGEGLTSGHGRVADVECQAGAAC